MDKGVLTSKSRDKSEDRSIHIEIQKMDGDWSTDMGLQWKGWRQEYTHRGSKKRVETRVLTLRYRDKGGERSTHIKIQR